MSILLLLSLVYNVQLCKSKGLSSSLILITNNPMDLRVTVKSQQKVLS